MKNSYLNAKNLRPNFIQTHSKYVLVQKFEIGFHSENEICNKISITY